MNIKARLRAWLLRTLNAQELDPPEPLGRLTPDGKVRIPANLIDKLGLRTGDFVFFVEEPPGLRIITEDQMAELLEMD